MKASVRLVFVLLGLAACLGAIAWLIVVETRRSIPARLFGSLELGMAREQVLGHLGSPTVIAPVEDDEGVVELLRRRGWRGTGKDLSRYWWYYDNAAIMVVFDQNGESLDKLLIPLAAGHTANARDIWDALPAFEKEQLRKGTKGSG